MSKRDNTLLLYSGCDRFPFIYPEYCKCNFKLGELDNFFSDLTDLFLISKERYSSIHFQETFDTCISGRPFEFLQNGLFLISGGFGDAYIDLVMDFEFCKILRSDSELDDLELVQLLVIKRFISIIWQKDYEGFEDLVSRFCGNIKPDLQAKLEFGLH